MRKNASKRRRSRRWLAVLAVAWGTATVAPAAEENFNYASGSLFGQNGGVASGGIAWTGSWSDAASGQSAAVITGINLGTVGGLTGTSPIAEYTTTPGGNVLNSTRSFTAQSNSASVYVYGLMRAGQGGGGAISTGDNFGGIGLYEGSTEKFLLGQRYNQANWGATAASSPLNGAGNNSGTAIGAFSTALIMARINQQTNTLGFFVNPVLNELEAQNVNAGRRAFTFDFGTGDDDIDTIRIRNGNAGRNTVWQFDNLNVQNSTPFPVAPLRTTSPSNLGSSIYTLNLSTSFPAYADIPDTQSGFGTVNGSPASAFPPFVFMSLTGSTAQKAYAISLLQERAVADGYAVLTGGAIPSGYGGFLRSGTTWDVVLQYATHPSPTSPYYALWDFGNAPGVSLDQVLIVPEPSSAAVVLAGVGLLSLRRRRAV